MSLMGLDCYVHGLENIMNFAFSSREHINILVFLFYQGALIASSLVLIQQTEHSCPKVAKFREIYAKVISDKHEDIIAKFGATLAQGILDAGEYLHIGTCQTKAVRPVTAVGRSTL